ncbi:hypothetical protein B0H13DRAFT_1892008 [Mycena leptocephala]|nr:hypothetical protein B0H13DRAFT_1892008 [Mycena leptocephala]
MGLKHYDQVLGNYSTATSPVWIDKGASGEGNQRRRAVERALRAWSTGNLAISSTNKRDHFSKDNWADTTKTIDGKDLKDRRATEYVRTLLDFTPEQWTAIEEHTSQWMPKKCDGLSWSSSMDASGMDELPSDEDDHFVLKADAWTLHLCQDFWTCLAKTRRLWGKFVFKVFRVLAKTSKTNLQFY